MVCSASSEPVVEWHGGGCLWAFAPVRVSAGTTFLRLCSWSRPHWVISALPTYFPDRFHAVAGKVFELIAVMMPAEVC